LCFDLFLDKTIKLIWLSPLGKTSLRSRNQQGQLAEVIEMLQQYTFSDKWLLTIWTSLLTQSLPLKLTCTLYLLGNLVALYKTVSSHVYMHASFHSGVHDKQKAQWRHFRTTCNWFFFLLFFFLQRVENGDFNWLLPG